MMLLFSAKLDLLRALLIGANFKSMLDSLSEQELLNAHRFVWEKTVEIGIKMRGRQFPQEELQAALRALAELVTAKDCPADAKQCNLRDCAERHPRCMREVATAQIVAMGAAAKEYLQLQNQP
jgi:hypothetical protein